MATTFTMKQLERSVDTLFDYLNNRRVTMPANLSLDDVQQVQKELASIGKKLDSFTQLYDERVRKDYDAAINSLIIQAYARGENIDKYVQQLKSDSPIN